MPTTAIISFRKGSDQLPKKLLHCHPLRSIKSGTTLWFDFISVNYWHYAFLTISPPISNRFETRCRFLSWQTLIETDLSVHLYSFFRLLSFLSSSDQCTHRVLHKARKPRQLSWYPVKQDFGVWEFNQSNKTRLCFILSISPYFEFCFSLRFDDSYLLRPDMLRLPKKTSP